MSRVENYMYTNFYSTVLKRGHDCRLVVLISTFYKLSYTLELLNKTA